MVNRIDQSKRIHYHETKYINQQNHNQVIIHQQTVNMKTTGKYEHLRKAAAEARQRTLKVDKVDDHGLASVRQVKVISTGEEAGQKINNAKHMAIIKWVTEVNEARQTRNHDWNTPVDWRMVTEKTVHKYVPFEQNGMQLSEAVKYVTECLAKHERPKNGRVIIGEDTPLWYLSRNKLRRALYRASINRARGLTN